MRSDWEAARLSASSNEVNDFDENYLRTLWSWVDEPADAERRRSRADLIVLNVLRARLSGADAGLIRRLADAALESAALVDHPEVRIGPLYPTLDATMQAVMDSSLVVQARVSHAIARTLDTPRLPDPAELLRGVGFMLDAYRALPRPLPRDAGSSGVVLGIVAALLAERTDLASELIALRSTQPEHKRQFAMLKALTKWLEKRAAGPAAKGGRAVDPAVERKFFEVFNAYRLPLNKQCTAALGGDHRLGTNYKLIDAYLYAWIYLLYFAAEPSRTTSWDTIAELLTA